MRGSVTLLVLATAVVNSTAQDTKKDDVQIKCEAAYLEKTWDIKLKSVKIVPGSKPNFKAAQIVLEFGKDLDNVADLQAAVSGSKGKLMFYLFDEDNVVVTKIGFTRQEGLLTGKKGDAFRFVVDFPDYAHPPKTRKIEIRLDETK